MEPINTLITVSMIDEEDGLDRSDSFPNTKEGYEAAKEVFICLLKNCAGRSEKKYLKECMKRGSGRGNDLRIYLTPLFWGWEPDTNLTFPNGYFVLENKNAIQTSR